jgi:hypothetical protein
MIVKSDVPAVFRQAIAEGRLSNRSPTNNAAFYMYMYTDDAGVDQFKHLDTRRYLPIETSTTTRKRGTVVNGIATLDTAVEQAQEDAYQDNEARRIGLM